MENSNALNIILVTRPQFKLKLVPLVNFRSAISTIINLILSSIFFGFKSTYNFNFKYSLKVNLKIGIFTKFLTILQNLNNKYIALVF